MKKIIITVASAASMFLFNACNQRDVVTPAVVEQSTTSSGVRSFDFSLMVIPTGTKGAKASGLASVKVTAVQNGNIVTKETDQTGLVIFSNLNEGNVAWYVTVPTGSGVNYAKLSGTTLMSASSVYFNAPNHSNQKGVVSQIVKLPTLNANLKGKVLGDFDFNTKTPLEANTGVVARLIYEPSNTATSIGTAGTSYHPEPNFYISAVAADGSFSFANVPALDNNTDINARLILEYFGTNNGQTYRFAPASPFNSIGDWLKADRTYDMGTIELVATGLNTASVTGQVFGDFTFANKVKFDANYAVTYPTGSVTINNGTTLGFGNQIENMDYVVIGGTTLLGLVYNDLDNKPVTLTGSNNFPGANDISLSSFANISTLPGYSAADFLRQNLTIAGLSHILRYNVGSGTPFAELIPANSVPYAAANYFSSNVVVELNYQAPLTYNGPTKFVTKTDGATGRFSINGIPSGNYTATFSYEGSFTMKDGYVKNIRLTSTAQRANTFVVSLGGIFSLSPNTVNELGAIELR